MSIKNLVIVIIFILFFSCGSNSRDITGEYESFKPNFIEKIVIYLKYKGYIQGTHINLKDDSTFVMSNCLMCLSGKWAVSNDTVLLYYETKKFHIDSLNNLKEWKKNLLISKIPDKYIKTNNGFKKIYKNKNNTITIEKLAKKPDN